MAECSPVPGRGVCSDGTTSQWTSRGVEAENKGRQNGDENAQGSKTRGEYGWLGGDQEEKPQWEKDPSAEGAQDGRVSFHPLR